MTSSPELSGVLLRRLLGDSGCVVYCHDLDAPFTIRAVEGDTEPVVGLRPDQLIGRPLSDFIILSDWELNHQVEHGGTLVADVRARHFSGATSWVRIRSHIQENGDGFQMLGIAMDIDSLKRRELDLARQVRVDALTGLLSRESFLDEVRRAIDRLEGPLALGIMDLDGFKQINDTLGHPFGDAVLQEIGTRLASLCDDQLAMARLGGDEFGLLVFADAEAAAKRIAIVAEAVGEEMRIGDVDLRTRGSIGWAVAEPGLTTPELMRQADVAMYDAKRQRTGQQRYEANDDHRSVESLDRVAHLARSLERELVMWFQPLVDLDSGEPVALEALARWCHPDRGIRSPAEFLPLIEQGGLRTRFDMWALEAISAAAHLKTPSSGEPMRLAMNVSVDGLRSPQFLPRIRQLRRSETFAADQLSIEISEKDLDEDLAKIAPILHELRALGIGLSLDDFGTGFSSLIRLKDLPFTEVKIDRSFVSGIVLDHTDHTIVRTTIDMGSSLGLHVVAEGVESFEIAEMLADMRCHVGQGFRFAVPAPIDSLMRDGFVTTEAALRDTLQPPAIPVIPQMTAESDDERARYARIRAALAAELLS